MTIENLTPSPEAEKQVKAEKPLKPVAVASIVPSIKLPGKYKGKSVEEVVEMHMNAERKISSLGTKVHELNDRVLQASVQAIPANTEKIAPNKESYYDDPYAYTAKEVATLKTHNNQLSVGLTVLMARQNKSMPKWSDHEAEILKTVNEKPYLLSDKDWPKVAYDLFMAKQPVTTPDEGVKEKQMEDAAKAEAAKIEADKAKITAADAEVKAPPAPAPKPIADVRKEKLALAKSGKINWEEYLEDTLSDAELKEKD